MRDAVQAGLDDMIVRSVGPLTLFDDPETYYLSEFQKLAEGIVDGPRFFMDERSRLELYLERLAEPKYERSRWEEFHGLAGDVAALVSHIRFPKAVESARAQVNAHLSALNSAFSEVFDTEYSPGDLVLFMLDRIPGINVMNVAEYYARSIRADEHEHVYLHFGSDRVTREVRKDRVLCRAEPTRSFPIDETPAAVYRGGVLESFGYAGTNTSAPDNHNLTLLVVYAVDSPRFYTHEDLETRDAFLLRAKTRGEKKMPHAGPYR